VLHHLVSPGGKVVAIDHIPALVDWSVQNLKNDGLGTAIDKGELVLVAGDGRQGYASAGRLALLLLLVLIDVGDVGPYDAIHVGAAAASVPQSLIDQLASPGRMFIPVGTFMQFIEQIDKDKNGKLTRTKVMGVRVRFVSVFILLLVGADIGLVCPIDG
jgi:protein-L-isoaspartate(D-aspartate) O-methyltransferase